ncbi:hypothetical protein [Parathermosynechococcus lividus]
MCGLTGFWQPNGCAAENAASNARRMADALIHQRLAILDLSLAGHQPMMVSVGGRPFTVINVSQVTGKISVPKTKNSGENNA